MDINELSQRTSAIRDAYHALEIKQDGHPWTTEQDALAFMTDAGLVARQVMNRAGSWPESNAAATLDYKIAESIWWLTSLATANNIDLDQALATFLSSREGHLK